MRRVLEWLGHHPRHQGGEATRVQSAGEEDAEAEIFRQKDLIELRPEPRRSENGFDLRAEQEFQVGAGVVERLDA